MYEMDNLEKIRYVLYKTVYPVKNHLSGLITSDVLASSFQYPNIVE